MCITFLVIRKLCTFFIYLCTLNFTFVDNLCIITV
nr:MAG TPA: hypothetical protein [Caudoviricetes sp.]